MAKKIVEDTQPDPELDEYLKDVYGVIEANSFESLMLWKEYTNDGKNPSVWVSEAMGYGRTVGMVGKMPVFISILTSVVKGKKLLFIHPTSTVVHWGMIWDWLKKKLPVSAFLGNDPRNYIHKENAMNFSNIFIKR